jgi:calcineurin-like phosphoesterase family protein
LNFPSLPNFSTFFSSSFALEIKWGKLNDRLDKLQETLIGSLNKTVDDVTLHLGDVKNSFTEIENKTSDIIVQGLDNSW